MTDHRNTTEPRVRRAITQAFFADVPLRIEYRDGEGEATDRVVQIKELHRRHFIARCLLRDGEYRRFNLDRIGRATVVRRSLSERLGDHVRRRHGMRRPRRAH